MVSLYLYIFFHAKLYSDAGLQIFFLIMQFYGWYEWTRGPVEHATSLSEIKRLDRRGGVPTAGGGCARPPAPRKGVHPPTPAAPPLPHAIPTLLSVLPPFPLS